MVTGDMAVLRVLFQVFTVKKQYICINVLGDMTTFRDWGRGMYITVLVSIHGVNFTVLEMLGFSPGCQTQLLDRHSPAELGSNLLQHPNL